MEYNERQWFYLDKPKWSFLISKITDKPVSALCIRWEMNHVGGGGVFVNDSKTQGQLPHIIAILN